MNMNDPWTPPAPPDNDEPLVTAHDPRVEGTHREGTLPCPNNPPPPVGWSYWKGHVPHGGVALAVEMQGDRETYPMGTFLQTRLEGELVSLRVEWHNVRASTGEKGCFRGVNLMSPKA